MHYRNNKCNQSGFSLVELLVSMTVMLIIMGSVFSLMSNTMRVSSTTLETTDAQQSLRTAHEYINRDLITVGDGLRGINNIRLPLTFVQAYLSSRPAAQLDSDGDGYVNLPIISSDDEVLGTTVVVGANPAANVLGNTDRLTILSIDPSFVPISLSAGPPPAINPSGSNISIPAAAVGRFNNGEIYYITNGSAAAFGTITNGGGTTNLEFAAGDVCGINQPGNGGPINVVSAGGTLPTTLLRMRIIHYFINDRNLLIRRVFGVGGGQGFVDSVIAEHARGLEFRYILNLTNPNGTMQQPVTQLATAAQQSAVRQVEVAMMTETVHPINNGARQTVDATTRTGVRNLQFREATQPTSTNGN